MEKTSVSMKVGSNIGNIIFEIAQQHIKDGNPERAISTYLDGFHGFTEEYAMKCIKNEAVLIASEDGTSVNLSEDLEDIVKNIENKFVWNQIVSDMVDEMDELRKLYWDCRNELQKYNVIPYDFPILEYAQRIYGGEVGKVGLPHLLAKRIADKPFSDLSSNGENVWEHMINNVENDDLPNKFENICYWVYKYVELIRNLHKIYKNFCSTYDFLIKHQMCKKCFLVENTLDNVLIILTEFCDPNCGYYHPMCNTEIYLYKEEIDNDILNTSYGQEFRKYGILKKDIVEGYDAGYLSPEGDFYGMFGETSSMIHMQLADKLIEKKYAVQYEKMKENYKYLDPENFLNKIGFMKVHGNECYGFYKHFKDKGDEYLYCPTKKQIELICEYIDANHNGKLHTEAQCVKMTKPVSTYQLKQMDEVKLHEIFSL